jgi:hypothetical protein
MSREDVMLLASRTLAVLLTVWALAEFGNLPGYLQSLLYYLNHEVPTASNAGYLQYMRHHYLIDLSFALTKAIGFSLLARWLFKGGPEVFELLLPTTVPEISIAGDSQ